MKQYTDFAGTGFVQTHIATVTPKQDHCTDRGASEFKKNRSGGKEINFVRGNHAEKKKKKNKQATG